MHYLQIYYMTSKYFVHLQVTAMQMMIEICQIVAVVSDIAKLDIS